LLGDDRRNGADDHVLAEHGPALPDAADDAPARIDTANGLGDRCAAQQPDKAQRVAVRDQDAGGAFDQIDERRVARLPAFVHRQHLGPLDLGVEQPAPVTFGVGGGGCGGRDDQDAGAVAAGFIPETLQHPGK
jgi:hypothetical protein